MKEIIEALRALGVTGKVSARKHDSFTAMVNVDGKKFGIWDKVKKTFVE